MRSGSWQWNSSRDPHSSRTADTLLERHTNQEVWHPKLHSKIRRSLCGCRPASLWALEPVAFLSCSNKCLTKNSPLRMGNQEGPVLGTEPAQAAKAHPWRGGLSCLPRAGYVVKAVGFEKSRNQDQNRITHTQAHFFGKLLNTSCN